MDKTLILASFVPKEELDGFIDSLSENFGLNKADIFQYSNLEDTNQVIITYRITIPKGEYLDIRKEIPNAVIIHKKGDALYTINALNRLIDDKSKESVGNIDYKNFKINWDEYQNTFLLTNNNQLSILKIMRIF